MKQILNMVVLVLLTGCASEWQKCDIRDVSKPETIRLKKLNSQGYIHYFKIDGQGYLDGTAEIDIKFYGTIRKTEPISGNICFHWYDELYSDAVEIEYRPISARGGKLTLDYKFSD